MWMPALAQHPETILSASLFLTSTLGKCCDPGRCGRRSRRAAPPAAKPAIAPKVSARVLKRIPHRELDGPAAPCGIQARCSRQVELQAGRITHIEVQFRVVEGIEEFSAKLG